MKRARMGQGDDGVKWVLTCMPGLEKSCVREVDMAGGVARVDMPGVVLATNLSKSSDALKLRCADTIGVHVGSLELTMEESDVAIFRSLCSAQGFEKIAPSAWKTAFEHWKTGRAAAVSHGIPKSSPPKLEIVQTAVWADLLRNPDAAVNDAAPRKTGFSFKVDCKRSTAQVANAELGSSAVLLANCSRHKYISMDINQALGAAIAVAQPAWQVKLKDPCLVCQALIYGKSAVISFLVASVGDARSMQYTGKTATTRPFQAATMWELVGDENPNNSLVCDIGCGSGTFFSEVLRSNFSSAGFCVGGDLCPLSASNAQRNVALIGSSGQTDVVLWDMRNLPIRDNSQDICLCDLPFGKAHQKFNKLDELYRKAAREISRVLVVGGRAILMGVLKRASWGLVTNVPLKVKSRYIVEKGGYTVGVLVLEKVQPCKEMEED